MKQLLTFIVALFTLTTFSAHAQFPGMGTMQSPVKWTGAVEQTADGSYKLIFKADIKDGWHVFSQFTPEGGSLPLQIKYLDDGKGYQTQGKTQESETHRQFNEVFGVDEIIFENEAVLTQPITVTNPDLSYVKAQLNYQVCKESCINEEYYIVFDLKKKEAQLFTNYDEFMAYGDAPKSETPEADPVTEEANSPVSNFGFGSSQPSGTINPVKWTGAVKAEADGSYDLIFKADIQDGWHIFSQFTAEGGSLPLQIKYLEADKAYTTNGKTEESETHTQFNEVFGVDETIFEEQAILTQNITPNTDDLRYIKAQLNYQVCKESCINEEYYVVFDLEKEEAIFFSNYDEFMAYGSSDAAATQVEKSDQKTAVTDGNADTDSTSSASNRSLWTVFLLAFLWGFAALLTPCVFPMIPMTVSFFIKQSKTKALGRRNAILYSLFIIIIYVLLGTLVTAIFGADSLNALSTNVTFNIVFFLILVVFAASFLGAFEIVLPSSWANKVDRQADRGGIIGIFFMALALAIVSFSCTGPIIGTLLVQASSQGGLAPVIGMLGFSIALAIPFGLFALFPGWMNSLPKSGGWLNAVKVVLGLLELAFAFKFLSNADLVTQSHLLPREIFLSIWIAIFGVMAMYLFGKIQLPHDSKIEKIGVGRLGLGLVVLSFTIYLIPGLWGAPLKLISGFPPPMIYSESPDGVGYSKMPSIAYGAAQSAYPEGAEPGPHDIMAFKDYDQGIAYAQKVGKPVLLDFTGMACVNCRKMEERVWSQPEVLSILKNEVVLISLYVDVKEELPKDEQYTSKTTGKRITTVGEKWSDFQIERYQVNAQPYYVLISPETEENLEKAVGYLPDAQAYKAWLESGIANYKK